MAYTPVTIHTVITILRKRMRIFLGVGAVVAVCICLVWYMRPVTYTVSVLLDIARVGMSAITHDYTYDEYYRLQADERFAETVAHWLRTPRVVDDILQTATVPLPQTFRGRERFFKAHRVSPQSINVLYSVSNPLIGMRIAGVMSEYLNGRAAALNYDKREQERWFVIRVSDPVIMRDTKPWWLVVSVGVICGIIVGTGVVFTSYLLRHTKRRQPRKKD